MGGHFVRLIRETVEGLVRYHLHQQLEYAVGEKGATTLMELLPPVGWADVATKRDVDQLGENFRLLISAQIADVKGEVAELKGEVSAQIAGVKGEVAELKGEVAEVGSEIASAKAEFEKTMRHQLTVLLSAMVSIAGLVLALSVYGPS